MSGPDGVNRPFHARRAVVALLAGAALSACTSGNGGAASAGADTAAQRRLDAVLVGSDRELPDADADLVNAVGLQASTLGVSTRDFWSVIDDPATPAAERLARADAVLARMRDTTASMRDRALGARTELVRDALLPYADRWSGIVRALTRVRAAVANGDRAARQAATDDADVLAAQLADLDRARVARVVAVLGPDEARRLLAREGLDPGRFGL